LREPVEPASNVPVSPPEPRPVPVTAVRQAAPPADTARKDYVVQVMATTTRAEADGVVRRLSAKGYSAFVTPIDGASKSPYRFRVRVGRYTKRDAESAAQRLAKEEQFRTWVTR
jgi:cell division septation protein DedD